MENKNINKTQRNNKDRSPPMGAAATDKKAPCFSLLLLAFVPPLEKYKIGVEIVCSLCKLVASTKVKARESST